jgi:hypothetical protein
MHQIAWVQNTPSGFNSEKEISKKIEAIGI